MLIFIRGIKLAVVLVLMGLGSCSLHSGFNPRGYGTGGENVAVGFGVAVLAGALMLFRKWFWLSSDIAVSPLRQPQQAQVAGQARDREVVLSQPAMPADFPIHLWADQKEPFRTWHGPDTQVPHEIADLFRTTAHAYLFFVWHIWVSREFGLDVAARVRTEQIKRIDRLGNQIGQHLFSLVDEIQRTMSIATEKPMAVPGHPDMQVPPLYGVALSLLTTWRDSPYYLETGYRGAQLPNMNGDDFLLAECLAHCGEMGGPYFSNVLRTVAVDARALSGWAQHGARDGIAGVGMQLFTSGCRSP